MAQAVFADVGNVREGIDHERTEVLSGKVLTIPGKARDNSTSEGTDLPRERTFLPREYIDPPWAGRYLPPQGTYGPPQDGKRIGRRYVRSAAGRERTDREHGGRQQSSRKTQATGTAGATNLRGGT